MEWSPTVVSQATMQDEFTHNYKINIYLNVFLFCSCIYVYKFFICSVIFMAVIFMYMYNRPLLIFGVCIFDKIVYCYLKNLSCLCTVPWEWLWQKSLHHFLFGNFCSLTQVLPSHSHSYPSCSMLITSELVLRCGILWHLIYCWFDGTGRRTPKGKMVVLREPR